MSLKPLIVAKIAGVDLEVETVKMGVDNKSSEYLAKFPFGKVPAFECEEGNVYESSAICYYIAAKHKPELLGKNAMEQALVVQFLLAYDGDLNSNIYKLLTQTLGWSKYDEKDFESTLDVMKNKLRVLDSILSTRTFLVGESITIADIAMVCGLSLIFGDVIEASDRSSMMHLTRYFITVRNQPYFLEIMGAPKLCTHRVIAEPVKPTPAPKASEEQEEEEEEAKPAPKVKNAMDLLPPSKFNLEDWKRYYSNAEETRPDATNWFWNHYDPEGFSIWRADYMYNEELKKIFMTCNLITGLFHRMDAMRRYCFASVLVFGEDDCNEISGMFVIRGQEIPDLLKDVPDFEVYNWTKVDTNDPVQRELIDDYWAWEGKFEGKKFNEGKVFK